MAQDIAQCAAQVGPVDKGRDLVMAVGDDGGIRRGAGHPAFHQPGAGCRQRPVDAGQQRIRPPASKGLGQFEVAPCRGVERHRRRHRHPDRRSEKRQAAFLRDLEVPNHCAHRGKLGPFEIPEPVQGRDAERVAQGRLGAAAVELAVGQAGGGNAQIRKDALDHLQPGFRDQNLARAQPRKLGAKPMCGQGLDREIPGRDIAPGQRGGVAHPRDGGQEIVAPRIQQRVLGQGAGGDNAHHVPFHDSLRAPLLRLCRVFKLFADRHPEPLADQRQQVAIGAVGGHAAHRDVVAFMLAAPRQRDIQRLGRRDRVVEEHLVEIAHPVEQQRIRVPRLDVEILRHHRRDRGGHAHPPCRMGRAYPVRGRD